MLALCWELGQELGMLPGRLWEAHRGLLEHSLLAATPAEDSFADFHCP